MAAAATIATKPPALATPVSATYPSELRSPLVGTPTFIKREDDMKTPITPPTAYVDFLKALSPTLMSPLAKGSSQKFPASAGDSAEKAKAAEPPNKEVAERSNTSTPDNSAISASSPKTEPAATHPPLSRNISTESADSNATSTTTNSAASTASAPTPMQTSTTRERSSSSTSTSRPEVPHPIQIPPTSAAYSRPASARRTPRGTSLHMHIPGVSSPYSPSVPSPLSGGARSTRSIQSPFGSTMSPYSTTMSPYNTSAGPWSANTMSPRDRENQVQIASPPITGSGSSRVSVRQVVTRTVTYSRTPLDPAPKGKRRRVEDEGEEQ